MQLKMIQIALAATALLVLCGDLPCAQFDHDEFMELMARRQRGDRDEDEGPNGLRAAQMADALKPVFEYRSIDDVFAALNAPSPPGEAPAALERPEGDPGEAKSSPEQEPDGPAPLFQNPAPASGDREAVLSWARAELLALEPPDAEEMFAALLDRFLLRLNESTESVIHRVGGETTFRRVSMRSYPRAGLGLSAADLSTLVSLFPRTLTPQLLDSVGQLTRQVLCLEPPVVDRFALSQYREALLAAVEEDPELGRNLPQLLMLAGDAEGSRRELDERFPLGNAPGVDDIEERRDVLAGLSTLMDVQDELWGLQLRLLRALVDSEADPEAIDAHLAACVGTLSGAGNHAQEQLLSQSLELGLSESLLRAVCGSRQFALGWDVCLRTHEPGSEQFAKELASAFAREWHARAYVDLTDIAKIRSEFEDTDNVSGRDFYDIWDKLMVRVQALAASAPPDPVLDLLPEGLRASTQEAVIRVLVEVGEEAEIPARLASLHTADPETTRDLALSLVRLWTTENRPVEGSRSSSSGTSSIVHIGGVRYVQMDDEEELVLRPLDAQLDALARFHELLTSLEAIPGCEALERDAQSKLIGCTQKACSLD